MNQDEVESQLSAMFDGELPAAECELLSRRIERDETLRARWGRYALIGAAMRSEPVAAAPRGFAARVSAAIESNSRPRRLRRSSRLLWNGALAASLVVAVAGTGVSLLRTAANGGGTAQVAAAPAAALPAPAVASPVLVQVPASPPAPASYVTPAGRTVMSTGLRSELADYIVAHSAYSPPLLRRNVLSELVTGEEQAGMAVSPAAAGASQATAAGGGDGFGSPVKPRD